MIKLIGIHFTPPRVDKKNNLGIAQAYVDGRKCFVTYELSHLPLKTIVDSPVINFENYNNDIKLRKVINIFKAG